MARKKKLPLDPFTVVIDKLADDGFGVAEHEGRQVRIPGTLPGEKVSCVYTAQRRRIFHAKLVKLHERSNDRVEPVCGHFLSCGGCRLQHMSMSAQLAHKQARVKALFDDVGITTARWLAPITSPTVGYRNKARLGAKWLTSADTALVGFRELTHRGIAKLERCEVLHPSIGERIASLRDLLASLDAREQIPQIEVAVGSDSRALVFRHLCDLSSDDRKKLKGFADEHHIEIYLQSGGPDTLVALCPEHTRELHYLLPALSLKLEFQPLDFTQINPTVNEKLVSQALKALSLHPADRVLDLFCGLGNFALAAATQGASVTGLEGSQSLIDKATRNARLNALENVEFFTIDLFEPEAASQWTEKPWTKILLDPPRSGAQTIATQIRHKPIEKLVYVSCNPQTLARDADILVNQGHFRLCEIGVVDMFPHTDHVETMATFESSSV